MDSHIPSHDDRGNAFVGRSPGRKGNEARRSRETSEAAQKISLEENELHLGVENERFWETQPGRDGVPTYILDSIASPTPRATAAWDEQGVGIRAA